MKKIVLLIAFAFAVISCKHSADDERIIPAANLYSQGLTEIDKGYYKRAAGTFDKLYFQHPGNHITPYAELIQAYSLYLDTKYEDAIDILDHFLKYHPMHEDASYAHYMIGMSYYMQICDVQRDQNFTLHAKQVFAHVVSMYPNTKYALDAKLKLDLVEDHLAGKELEIGREYIRLKNPSAAINRYQAVVKHYSTTSHIQEALYRLVEAYMMLGIDDQATKYAGILGHNYPDTDWYAMAYKLIH